MTDVVCAFDRGEELEGDRHQLRDLVVVARARRAQERLQFGEHLLDGIEVGAVRWQKPKVRADRFDRRAHRGLLVDRQIVEDDDIAWPQGGYQDLLDIGAKTRFVDRAVKHGRRGHRIHAQGGNDGAGVPVTAGRVITDAGPTRTPTIAAQQIRGDATLIEEHVLPHIAEWLPGAPSATLRGDVGAPLFIRVNGFF
jgi:hypothetical protein